MPGSKPGALPLGDTPTTPTSYSKKLVSPQGFEPRTHGLEGRCSIQLSYEPTKIVERMMRIELTPSAWKAEVLPLNYIRTKLERKTRFELATLALARRCSTPEPLPHMYCFEKMVEGDGFEPSKAQLTDLQSAPFGHSGIPRSFSNLVMLFDIKGIICCQIMELVEGIEPPTC